MLREFSLCVTLLTLFFSSLAQSLVIFGDSLSDEGRLYQLVDKTFPPSPFANGRFSNGPVWSEYLEGPRRNFAYGGARTDHTNMLKARLGAIVDNTGLQAQVEECLATPACVEDLKVSKVYISIGANDFLGVTREADSDPLIQTAIDNITDAALQLKEAGAKDITLVGLPNLAKIPMAQPLGMHQQQLMGIISVRFNNQLMRAAAWNRFTFFDTLAFVDEIMHHASHYGLTNWHDACFDEINNIVCSNPDEYFFWDDKHPTTKIHALFAGQL